MLLSFFILGDHMAKKFKDFTKFIEERRKEAPSFQLFGEIFYLPPNIPYDAVLRVQALNNRDKTDELQDNDVFLLFKSIVGEDNEARLRKYGEFDVDVMVELIKYCLEVYGVTEETKVTSDENPK